MTIWLVRGGGAAALIAVAIFAAIVGWAREVSQSDPDVVLRVFPGHSAALLKIAEDRRTQEGEVSDLTLATGARLLRSQPLSEAPLVFAGLARAASGNMDQARETFAAARHRQPRNIPALSWLAADAIGRGEYARSAELLERLHALNHEQTEIYTAAWAATIPNPEAVAVLEERLSAGSILAKATLQVINPTIDNLDLLIRLNAHAPDQQARLLENLLNSRGPALTFLAWLEFAPTVETRDFSWPFDPAFVGNDAPTPFNWTLAREAEILEQGGLYARYSGKLAPELAGQLMLLAPGAYIFKTEMQGNADQSKGAFEWVLACYRASDAPLAMVAVNALSSKPNEFSGRFTVPRQTCAAQTLTLRGKPGEFPARVTATVNRVSIQPDAVTP
jgi:tetratricopeptide (TPR) repeat protein